ncbi:energy transducer TonB [Granulicella arctica]|uniref:energy transducer TonB n=1 Tax=Granulicella arctica TaxID=940613 RepID=UPI0021E0E18F|nr:energy transducer TonB [Granulicella arctica]
MRSYDRSKWVRVSFSVTLHLVILAALVHTRKMWVAPMLMPGDAHGSRMVLTYLPGQGAVSGQMPVKAAVTKVAPKTALDKAPLPAKTQVAAAAVVSPPSAHPNGVSGDDAFGSGNVNIALVRSFPTPKPDLSRLPRGTVGDVVVDIVIDADGKVSSLTTTKGLGFGVDEVVVATVQQWVFQPATKDGKPVASEQELHFHYERA